MLLHGEVGEAARELCGVPVTKEHNITVHCLLRQLVQTVKQILLTT